MTDQSLTDADPDEDLDDDMDDELDDDEEFDDDNNDDDDEGEGGPDGNLIKGALAKSMLEYLAKAIVDDAESVIIEVEEGRRGTTLRLHVAPSDMGRIIGRRGRVAQAIRTVVRAAAAREGVEAIVDIAD